MTYTEALTALMEGKTIRRPHWHPNARAVGLHDNFGLRPHYRAGSPYIEGYTRMPEWDVTYLHVAHTNAPGRGFTPVEVRDEDKTADDWEEYEPPQASPAAHWYSRPPAEPDWLLGLDPTMPAERTAQWPACGTWAPPEAHTTMKARLASIAAAAAKQP